MKTTIALCVTQTVVFSIMAFASGIEPAPLTPVPFTDVTIADEFWAARLKTNRVNTVWHDIQKCEETGRISNFAKAAGLMEGEFQGIYFDDSDVYKVLEGASYSLGNHPDPALERKVDEIITLIASAQQEDGYLFCYNALALKNDPAKRWIDLRDGHELYCAGHLFEAAVAHHRATGRRNFLDVAIRLADHIDSVFGPDKRRDVPGHEEIELALVKLWRLTGEQRYFELAKFFLDERGRANGRKLFGAHYQDHQPVRDQSEITGHAVRAMYLYSGTADVAGVTGDAGLVTAMNRLWDSVAAHKMYVTGGIGVVGHGEGFSEDYFLPNVDAYAETCAAIGLALWSHRLNLMHKYAGYFDVFERALFNGLLSGVSLDGKEFFYVNPLESRTGRHERIAWYGCSCCPSNIVRFIPSVGGYIYAHDTEDDVYVNLYVAGKGTISLDGITIDIVQETRYPWNGKVQLTVNPAREAAFTLNLRIPGWCREQPVPNDLYVFDDALPSGTTTAQVRINGESSRGFETLSGYAKLKRAWKKGDIIELDMPMPVRRVKAHPEVKDDTGCVALQRGPVVYCLEEIDNGATLRDIYLPDDATLTAEYRHDLLGGVTVVKANAMQRTEDGLFQEKEITAVPYYSWNNRDMARMITWLPREAKYLPRFAPPTIASRSTVSVSHCYTNDTPEALNDRIEPEKSSDTSIPRMTWWGNIGTNEWVQYEFQQEATVSAVKVYWFDDTGFGACRAPQSWKLLYRDNGRWNEVTNTSAFGTEIDQYNHTAFAPVKTDGLRIEVRLQPEASGGILEWSVEAAQ